PWTAVYGGHPGRIRRGIPAGGPVHERAGRRANLWQSQRGVLLCLLGRARALDLRPAGPGPRHGCIPQTPFMKKILALFFAACLSAPAAEPVLKVENRWIVEVPPNAKDSAAFLTVVNPGTVPVKITGARTEAARRVAPMATTNSGGSLGMKDVPF